MHNLLVFDLDGTLFDTALGISKAFNSVLVERNEKPIPHEKISTFIGTGLRSLLIQLDSALQYRLGDLLQLESDFKRHYSKLYLDHSEVYPGVVAFLESWPYDLAIVSNKNEEYVLGLIAQKELRLFNWQMLVGGDTFVEKKPHPMPLQEVIRAVGTTPDKTIMIGDGLPDIQAAINAKVKSIAVDFGYSPISDLINCGADATISNYGELSATIADLS